MKKTSKTTLAGFLAGLAILILPPIKARLSGDPAAPPITTHSVTTALGIAILGKLAADGDHSH